MNRIYSKYIAVEVQSMAEMKLRGNGKENGVGGDLEPACFHASKQASKQVASPHGHVMPAIYQTGTENREMNCTSLLNQSQIDDPGSGITKSQPSCNIASCSRNCVKIVSRTSGPSQSVSLTCVMIISRPSKGFSPFGFFIECCSF